ncbi:MAG: hypothetical protein ACYC01_12570, partial [Lutibacter sp.]
MKLNIKNMVSNSCKMMVKEELKKLGLHFIVVGLGEVDVLEDISEEQRNQLKIDLSQLGLELLDDTRIVLIEKIKNIIIEMILYSDEDETIKLKFSNFLSEKLHYNYTY